MRKLIRFRKFTKEHTYNKQFREKRPESDQIPKMMPLLVHYPGLSGSLEESSWTTGQRNSEVTTRWRRTERVMERLALRRRQISQKEALNLTTNNFWFLNAKNCRANRDLEDQLTFHGKKEKGVNNISTHFPPPLFFIQHLSINVCWVPPVF